MKRDEYVNYVLDKRNGLIKESKLDSFSYSAEFLPKKLLILKEHSKLSVDSIDQYEELYYNDIETVKISIKDKIGEKTKLIYGSNTNYATLINYTTTFLKHDVLMLDGKDTIPCFDTYFEPSYKINSNFSYLFTFKRRTPFKENYNDIKILFLDRVFSKKEFDFSFEKDKLNKANKIKII